jgi:acid phosphatase (class A)
MRVISPRKSIAAGRTKIKEIRSMFLAQDASSNTPLPARRRQVSFLVVVETVLLVFMLGVSLAAQSTSSSPRSSSRATGYLPDGDVNFLQIIPPYPALQSKEDQADVAVLRQWQQPGDSPRWKLAQADAELSYSRFSEAFGSEVSARKAPLLVHLLDRVEADTSLRGAKSYYHRPRPYQRFHFDHVCGFAFPPYPEASPSEGNSYPSGHTTFGWSAALVLAQVAPDRAQTILARGIEYGESRIVCAVHYPSDVLAAELFVNAAFGKLSEQPEFKRDLSCAQQEHAVALKTRDQISAECLSLRNQLGKSN